MKKWLFLIIAVVAMLTACTATTNEEITIKPLEDSEYRRTFQELHLGYIWDFNFTLPQANQRTVQLWVEKYSDGQRDENFEASLQYGMSPSDFEEGHIGAGLMDGEAFSLFLYAPSVKAKPQAIENLNLDTGMYTWEYAFQEKQALQLNTEYIIGTFRHSLKDTMRSGYDLSNEEEVQQLLHDDTNVLLLKIKVTESE